MSYATLQDLIDRFGADELLAIADRDGDGSVDADLVAAALADAAGTIDSYIGRRYTLPLSATPAQLTARACDIARWLLYTDMPHERVTKAHDAAVAWLKDVAAGRADLDAGGAEPAGDGPGRVAIDSGARVFSDDALSDY
jgi:phage gp36-like protein